MLRRLFPGVYEGWLVVIANVAVVTLIGGSFVYGFGTIFTSITDEFGWSVALTAVAFSARSEFGGLVSPVIGLMIDRLGPRRVLLFGVASAAAGVLLISFMSDLWQFFLGMVLIAVGTSSASGHVGLVATATWFDRRRGRALSVLTLGGATAGMLTVGAGWLVDELGWRVALRVMVVAVVAIGAVAALDVRSRPDDHPQPMDGIGAPLAPGVTPMPRWGIPVGEALRTRAFLFLTVAVLANGFGWTAVLVHQVPFLESLGASTTTAAAFVSVFAVATISGRLGFGYLADLFDKRYVYAAALAALAVGVLGLGLARTHQQGLVALLLVAPGFGGVMPVRPALIADFFGTAHFGVISGVSEMTMTIGAFLGPLVVGLAVDETGEYAVGWLLAAAALTVGIPAILAARPPTEILAHHRERALAAAPPRSR